ncbi:hypothetical protein LMHOCYYV_CDS0016 [Staphylococcus phage PG-2021_4]
MKKIRLLDTTNQEVLILTPKEVIELSEFYEDFYEDDERIEISSVDDAINNLTEFWHFELITTV